jgi:hypothetical protein
VFAPSRTSPIPAGTTARSPRSGPGT